MADKSQSDAGDPSQSQSQSRVVPWSVKQRDENARRLHWKAINQGQQSFAQKVKLNQNKVQKLQITFISFALHFIR